VQRVLSFCLAGACVRVSSRHNVFCGCPVLKNGETTGKAGRTQVYAKDNSQERAHGGSESVVSLGLPRSQNDSHPSAPRSPSLQRSYEEAAFLQSSRSSVILRSTAEIRQRHSESLGAYKNRLPATTLGQDKIRGSSQRPRLTLNRQPLSERRLRPEWRRGSPLLLRS